MRATEPSDSPPSAPREAPEPVPSTPATMRAVVQREYGPADVLRLEQVPPPSPGPGQVLVRVRAAAVTQGDWHLMTGTPYLVRLMGFGVRRPKRAVPGQYLAGTVEAVGPGAARFRPGDAVWGCGVSTFAELAVAAEETLAPLPTGLSFEQAAALPHGGLTALQGLRDAGRLQAGQRVLVIGASGAVGSVAVQTAKAWGAHVTGVCSAAKADFVRGLGADRVLDYARDDFAADGTSYDLILDMARDRPDADYRRALVPGGRSVLVSAGGGRWLGGMGRTLVSVVTSLFRSKKLVPMLARPGRADLEALAELTEAGRLTSPVDRVFPLAEAADAFRHHESRTARGMTLLTP